MFNNCALYIYGSIGLVIYMYMK